ncbi:MAG: hypothetical protein AAGD14_05325 [Planctomycetota bacterium]
MKYAPLALVLLLVAPAVAQEEPDPAQILKDLTAANKEKDLTVAAALIDQIAELAKSSKDQKALEPLAKELTKTFKLAKGNWGTKRKILDTLGALRAKGGLSLLKKTATMKDPKTDDFVSLKVQALLALGQFADSKLVDTILDQSKDREVKVAEAAYTAMAGYGVAKGKVRRKAAEGLMKRIEAEYPYTTGGTNSKNPGEAAIKRWDTLRKPIIDALQAVCHENTINDINNWREWWKENKKNARAWKNKKSA